MLLKKKSIINMVIAIAVVIVTQIPYLLFFYLPQDIGRIQMVRHITANQEAMEVTGEWDIIGHQQHIIKVSHIIIIPGRNTLYVANPLHIHIITTVEMYTIKAQHLVNLFVAFKNSSIVQLLSCEHEIYYSMAWMSITLIV